MKLYGYVRTSARGQNPSRQLEQLLEYGVKKENIYIEQQSGKDFERPIYQKMKNKMKPSDKLIVVSLSRIGRNRSETLEELNWFTKNTAGFVILDFPLLVDADTEMAKFLNELMLSIVTYYDQMERERMLEAQKKGIEIAKRNKRFKGRKRKFSENNEQVKHAFELLAEGELTNNEIIGKTGLSPATFYRRLKEFREKKALQETES